MKFLVISTLLFSVAYAQHGVDPAYLRQYYQQIAQQTGANPEATPIFEQHDNQQHYGSQGQQIRVRDNVQEQVRATQQQQQTQAYVAPHLRQSYPQAQAQVQYVPQPSPQPQQLLYRPSAPVQAPKPRRPTIPAQAAPQYQPGGNSILKKQHIQHDEEEEYEDPNASYQFGFDVKDDEFTNYQNRKESREGQVIKGSYSVVDSDGFIRTVKYTADPKEGFKAEVIREPTDIVVKVPTPAPQQLLSRPIKQQQQEYSPKLQHQQQHHQPQHQQQQQHQQQYQPQYQY